MTASAIAGRSSLFRFRSQSAVPGFSITFGFTIIYLSLIVLIPLGGLILRASGIGFSGLWVVATEPRVAAALKLSFGIAFLAAIVSMFFGFLVAWVLTRYQFPGRRLIDAMVDLPFALPTAVAGIALSALYAQNGLVGGLLAPYGIKIAYTPVGIFIAMVFVSVPFSVRTVQPLIADLDHELEEASAVLGANRWQTIWRVLVPSLIPAILTGFALGFARAVGEYGSIIFIAGNLPYVSEIAPLLIVIKLEEFDYTGATAIATVMLIISFSILLLINLIQAWSRKRFGYV